MISLSNHTPLGYLINMIDTQSQALREELSFIIRIPGEYKLTTVLSCSKIKDVKLCYVWSVCMIDMMMMLYDEICCGIMFTLKDKVSTFRYYVTLHATYKEWKW